MYSIVRKSLISKEKYSVIYDVYVKDLLIYNSEHLLLQGKLRNYWMLFQTIRLKKQHFAKKEKNIVFAFRQFKNSHIFKIIYYISSNSFRYYFFPTNVSVHITQKIVILQITFKFKQF